MSNNRTADIFSRVAADFDRIGPRFFSLSGQRLVELLDPAPGSRVLDVACGRGATLFPLAEKVGAQGQVFGIDLADGMLRHTQVDLCRSGLGHVHLSQMDATQLAFASQSFDGVLCSHSIGFFPAALAEFRRVLKPGGKTAMSIIASGCFDWLLETFRRYDTRDEPDDEAALERLALDTPAGLESALREAGFAQIQTHIETRVMLYPDEDTWWRMLWTLGFRQGLEAMSAETLSAFKAELFQALQRFRGPDGFQVPFESLYARAVE